LNNSIPYGLTAVAILISLAFSLIFTGAVIDSQTHLGGIELGNLTVKEISQGFSSGREVTSQTFVLLPGANILKLNGIWAGRLTLWMFPVLFLCISLYSRSIYKASGSLSWKNEFLSNFNKQMLLAIGVVFVMCFIISVFSDYRHYRAYLWRGQNISALTALSFAGNWTHYLSLKSLEGATVIFGLVGLPALLVSFGWPINKSKYLFSTIALLLIIAFFYKEWVVTGLPDI